MIVPILTVWVLLSQSTTVLRPTYVIAVYSSPKGCAETREDLQKKSPDESFECVPVPMNFGISEHIDAKQ